jgi:hypothetical protein
MPARDDALPPGELDARGVGICLCENRCLYDGPAILHESGYCDLCCPRAVWPGDCDDCVWSGADGEPFEDFDDE